MSSADSRVPFNSLEPEQFLYSILFESHRPDDEVHVDVWEARVTVCVGPLYLGALVQPGPVCALQQLLH